jgi:hypothetical protein
VIRSALVVAVLTTLLAGPAAQARGDGVLVDQRDPTDDVNIFDGGGTKPTTGQRKTIDLVRLTVARRDGGVRLSFTIARITGTQTFDQVVSAQLQKTGPGGFVLDVLANPQHKNGSAYLGGTFCLADVTTSRRTGTVRVDVPDRCLPEAAGVLRVSTYTQERNGSGPGFSEDTMRVKGTVALR